MVARGDVILGSLSGDYAKPRPTLVVQSNATLAITGSATLCLVTSETIEDARLRIDVVPTSTNGLKRRSEVQTGKIYTLPASKIRGPVGRIADEILGSVDLALALHLDLLAP